MLVLHGEHTVHTRDRLWVVLNEQRSNGVEVVTLEQSKLSPANLELALGAQSLFGQDKVLVIEHLHSLPHSKARTSLIKYLAEHNAQVVTQGDQAGNAKIILFEKRPLTKAMLKALGNPKAEEFKLTKSLFAWIDTLKPGLSKSPQLTHSLNLMHQAFEQDGEMTCLAMVARQARLLIQVVETGTAPGAPFMVAKLKQQAKYWSIPELLNLHKTLLELDLNSKSSNMTTLKQDLDLWLLSL